MKITLWMILLATLVLLLMPAASATTYPVVFGPGPNCNDAGNDCGPFIFTINATDTTASLSINNTSGDTWFLQAFTIQAFSGSITATGTNANALAGTIHNNVNQNNAGACNANGPNGAFCEQFNNFQILPGVTDFTFSIAGGTLIDLAHFQILLCRAEGCDPASAGKVALSGGPNTQTPEPSGLALLGSGLIGLGSVVRRKLIR